MDVALDGGRRGRGAGRGRRRHRDGRDRALDRGRAPGRAGDRDRRLARGDRAGTRERRRGSASRSTCAPATCSSRSPDELAGAVDLVVSNPPYVELAELAGAAARRTGRSRRQPSSAAPSCYGRLFAQAAACLRPGGAVVVEIGTTQGERPLPRCGRRGSSTCASRQDLTGRDRVRRGAAAVTAAGTRSPRPPTRRAPAATDRAAHRHRLRDRDAPGRSGGHRRGCSTAKRAAARPRAAGARRHGGRGARPGALRRARRPARGRVLAGRRSPSSCPRTRAPRGLGARR